jgi:hypothetical protein
MRPGVQAGDHVFVDLELDSEERTVEPPPELQAAFADEPELRAFFERLSYTHRKEYVRWIEEESERRRAARAPRRPWPCSETESRPRASGRATLRPLPS